MSYLLEKYDFRYFIRKVLHFHLDHDRIFTPKQMAKKLHVSTTTLRRYESPGLVPDVLRTASNRRYYTMLHVQAFLALRSLVKGFDLPIAYEVMSLLKQGHVEQALWMINVQQYNIQAEKQQVEEIMSLIYQTDFSKYRNDLSNWLFRS